MPKSFQNYCTIALISHTSKGNVQKSFKLGFRIMWTKNFQIYKIDSDQIVNIWLAVHNKLENS